MKDMATTRMLLTTALLAAVAALLTTPAQAFWMDVEGGGGSGAAVATPTAQPEAIPYLSHGIGVAESLFAGQPAGTIEPSAIPYLSQGIGVDESLFAGPQSVEQTAPRLQGSPDALDRFRQNQVSVSSAPDWMERYAARNETSTLALGGSPDAIDRYIANQQGSTLALGGSPDAIDRYMERTSVAAQGGTSGNEFDWTWVGLGAGLCGLLAAAMAGLFLSTRQRGRVALP